MDIDLLSRMVKELVLDEEEVALPGIGTFVAETMPAVFSDRGFTINPPYRKLSFRQKKSDSGRLAEFYAGNNNLDIEKAERIVSDFMRELEQQLKTKKSITFPGLGKLRATKENYYFFVCDEDMDIYPEGFGLEPVSLKTHEATPEEVSETMTELASLIRPEIAVEQAAEGDPEPEVKPDPEPVAEPVPEDSLEEVVVPDSEPEVKSDPESVSEPELAAENEPEPGQEPEIEAEPAPQPQPEASKPSGVRILVMIVITIVIAAVAFLLIFILLAHVAPDFIDSILYTKEELEILNS